jgi:mycofactocin glycosyltransferase
VNKLVFSLVKNTYLEENSQGCFLISKTPLRILRLNRSLFSALKHLEEKTPEGINDMRMLHMMLSLTFKGYLRLEKNPVLETWPSVSIIIPVRDQPDDLAGCLQSLQKLDYPPDRLEIIVVDDSSSTPVSEATSSFDIKLVRLEKSQGPAAARNSGASTADGDILAFLDADCTADENWLKDLVPFFLVEGIGAVGGFVDSFHKKGIFDRYEEAFSSLNMGKRIIFESATESIFYLPTCNMLVSKKAFNDTGGFKVEMDAGEDVDFCWRMRDRGLSLLYIPMGKVAHKHRNRIFQMLRRRSFYGASEAVLYSSHRNKRKRFTTPVFSVLSFMALVAAILLMDPFPLCAIPPLLGIDFYRKHTAPKRYRIKLSFKQTIASLRSYLSVGYFASFHLVRYYLILIIALGFVFNSLWAIAGFILILASVVDYYVKRPKLNYPVFLFYYTLEHLAYQTGVFWGCLKLGYFGSYIPVFKRAAYR